MNWAKGRKTRGRGTSFRGALAYALHDKDAATTERVGFVELRNLATDNPDRAWSEMMALCDAASDLKRRAGVKATGNKLARPVYAFTLNWHADDRPDAAHMRETALDALKTLGMDHLQAVLVEHTDRPHRHVHVIVNLIDPDTGKTVSLSNDQRKLDRWADTYEVTQGVIRSPDRRAKFEALDRGLDPPKRPQQASTREEWEATRGLNSEAAKAKMAVIKTAYAAHVTQLKTSQAERYRQRRAEGDRLWNGYREDRKAIRDRYQPFIDAIYKSRRKAPPHPYTEQVLHDLRETNEWRELGRRQFAERRAFNTRERHLLGYVANIVRLHYDALRRGDQSSLLMLAFSLKHRRASFARMQEGQKQALRQTQGQRRKARADTLRSACRHELGELATAYQQSRREMVARHAADAAAQRAEWKQLAAERSKVWSDFRREFTMPERAKAAEPAQSLRQQFNTAASGQERKVVRRRGDGDAQGGRSGDGGPAQTVTKEASGGWRARRKAEDRKADGTYKPRKRGGRDLGRRR